MCKRLGRTWVAGRSHAHEITPRGSAQCRPEVGRNFRNEGMDMTHNPEFTACAAPSPSCAHCRRSSARGNVHGRVMVLRRLCYLTPGTALSRAHPSCSESIFALTGVKSTRNGPVRLAQASSMRRSHLAWAHTRPRRAAEPRQRERRMSFVVQDWRSEEENPDEAVVVRRDIIATRVRQINEGAGFRGGSASGGAFLRARALVATQIVGSDMWSAIRRAPPTPARVGAAPDGGARLCR